MLSTAYIRLAEAVARLRDRETERGQGMSSTPLVKRMFAVVVKVEIPEGRTVEEGRKMLEAEAVPRIKQRPGFKTAYWLAPPTGREGLSFVIFEDEQSARAMAENVQVPEGVKLLHTEVREVVTSA